MAALQSWESRMLVKVTEIVKACKTVLNYYIYKRYLFNCKSVHMV